MKSSVICVILFFTRVCLLSVLGPSTLLKHISAYSCNVFSYIYFTLSIGYQTADVRLNTSVVCTKGSPHLLIGTKEGSHNVLSRTAGSL